jgi:hypothetical protein
LSFGCVLLQIAVKIGHVDFRDLIEGRLSLRVERLDRSRAKPEAGNHRQSQHGVRSHGFSLQALPISAMVATLRPQLIPRPKPQVLGAKPL